MVIAFLLAQLVLPGPSSGPIQLPGMICASGGCEGGPVVYRTSAGRSRLVEVTCDMTSDTCSDGRKITTTRSTPVPCEVSPDVWEMVGVDEGCYSVRGLESWAANTSYLSWGAKFDKDPWILGANATLEKQDGFYRISGNSTLSRARQGLVQREAGVWTSSCIMRTSGSQNARFGVYYSGMSISTLCHPDSSDTFSIYSCTQTISTQGSEFHVYSDIGHIDVQGCWLTRTDTPGRACWGGEAPMTCVADRHTISTEGWPIEVGEVSLVYTPGQAENAGRFLISASTFGVEGWEFYVRNDDTMSFFVHNDGTAIYSSDPLTWEPRPYTLRVRWGDGIVSFWRDGVLVGTRAMTLLPNSLPSTALIGRREASGYANGSIRTLTIRNY